MSDDSGKKTRQWMLDRVWDHYITNNEPLGCVNNESTYRGDDGRRCAAGLFMINRLYRKSWEGKNVHMLPVVAFYARVRRELIFLGRLQQVHDLSDDTTMLKRGLRGLAKHYGLEIPT